MNPQDAIDFSREALKTCMMVGGPILVASLLIGLLVGVFQAMTQVQDQTVSFVPKILLLIVLIGLCLPWLTDQMLDFSKQSFEKPMTQWAGNSPPALFPESQANPTEIQSQSALVDPRLIEPFQSLIAPVFQVSAQDEFELPRAETPQAFERPSANRAPFILPHYRISKAPTSETGG